MKVKWRYFMIKAGKVVTPIILQLAPERTLSSLLQGPAEVAETIYTGSHSIFAGMVSELIRSSIECSVKEPLNNLAEFWQRQVFKFEALILSIVILWLKSITKKLGAWLSPVGWAYKASIPLL